MRSASFFKRKIESCAQHARILIVAISDDGTTEENGDGQEK